MGKTNESNKIEEVRIYGVSSIVADELNNIADHMQVSRSSLLKIELRKIRDAHPEYMRQPIKKEKDF